MIGPINQVIWPGGKATPSGRSINVYPEAGRMWNAFYNRNSLKFFYNDDPIRKQTTYASSSSRIVAHETGHGLLDSLRPDLWNYTNFEVWSFHEAFGDILSLVLAVQDDQVANYVISQNNGNLRVPNVLSGMGSTVLYFNDTRTSWNHTSYERFVQPLHVDIARVFAF